MFSIKIRKYIDVLKTYDVKITPFRGASYTEDTTWIAYWYYTQYDQNADNVTFEIRGNFHQTYPNPPHLSIRVISPDGKITPWLHLSINQAGLPYLQPLTIAGKMRKKTKKHNQKNSKKKIRQKK